MSQVLFHDPVQEAKHVIASALGSMAKYAVVSNAVLAFLAARIEAGQTVDKDLVLKVLQKDESNKPLKVALSKDSVLMAEKAVARIQQGLHFVPAEEKIHESNDEQAMVAKQNTTIEAEKAAPQKTIAAATEKKPADIIFVPVAEKADAAQMPVATVQHYQQSVAAGLLPAAPMAYDATKTKAALVEMKANGFKNATLELTSCFTANALMLAAPKAQARVISFAPKFALALAA